MNQVYQYQMFKNSKTRFIKLVDQVYYIEKPRPLAFFISQKPGFSSYGAFGLPYTVGKNILFSPNTFSAICSEFTFHMCDLRVSLWRYTSTFSLPQQRSLISFSWQILQWGGGMEEVKFHHNYNRVVRNALELLATTEINRVF